MIGLLIAALCLLALLAVLFVPAARAALTVAVFKASGTLLSRTILNEAPRDPAAAQQARPAQDDAKEDDDSTPAQRAVRVSQQLRRSLLALTGEFVSDDGTNIDYKAMKHSEQFAQYKRDTLALLSVDLTALEGNELKAFLINIYNSLHMHALIALSPGSVLERMSMWASASYRIGAIDLSLEELEHGLLRCNSTPPGAFSPIFSSSDPRLKLAPAVLDPRIHFALNCGAKGCPRVRVYSADALDKQLDQAAEAFCEHEVRALGPNKVALSQLFSWYVADFGPDLAQSIGRFLPPAQRAEVQAVMARADCQLVYNYDWTSNQK